MKGLKRILKTGGVITAQVGSNDKKPKQVDNGCKVLEKALETLDYLVHISQVLTVIGISLHL